MKITRSFFLLLMAVVAATSLRAQVSQPDAMVQKIFATLQNKDEKAFVALYPNAAQFTKLMRSMMEQMLNTPEVKQAMAADPTAKNLNVDSLINAEVSKISDPESFAQMQKKFSSSFQQIIEKGEKKGVNWSNAQLTNFTIDTTAALDGELAALKPTGIKAMSGVIEFRSNNTDYHMSFDKVMYLPEEGGWFGGEFPQLARKNESLKPGEEGAAKTETKTKTKTTAGGTKTKKKTTTGKTTTKAKG